jgi:hypothetical protein
MTRTVFDGMGRKSGTKPANDPRQAVSRAAGVAPMAVWNKLKK